MDANQTLVQTLFNRYTDDQKSMLLEIIENANGNHEADLVFSGQINAYAKQGVHDYYQSNLSQEQIDALRSQVRFDLTKAGYNFRLAQPTHHDAPPPHHKKHQ